MSYMAIPGVYNPITMAIIEKVVCDDYGLQPEQLKIPTRKREILLPRQICIYIGRQIYELMSELKDGNKSRDYFSFNALGRRYGKDHATAIYSVTSIVNYVECDLWFRERVQRILLRIGGNLCQKLSEKLNALSKKA